VTALAVAGPANTVGESRVMWNWEVHPHLAVAGPVDDSSTVVADIVEALAGDGVAAVVVDPAGRVPGAARNAPEICAAVAAVHAEAARRYRSLWERTSAATPALVLAIAGIDDVCRATGSVSVGDQRWGRQLRQIDALGGIVSVHLAVAASPTARWPRSAATWQTMPAARRCVLAGTGPSVGCGR
jgi:hypothetical protein